MARRPSASSLPSFRVTAILAAAGGLAIAAAVDRGLAAEGCLTFFGWSDQHVATGGDGKHLLPAVEAMNSLPGTAYPAAIGGTVAEPSFVLGCGDITEWPTAAARDTYAGLLRQLNFSSYDVVGNHDEGGKSPSETIKRWIVARHGGLSYTFDRGGVHFVVLHSAYDESLNSPAQPLSQAALEFLRKDLAALPKATPVIVAMHLCLDAITNREELLQAMGDANVIAIVNGHYHQAKVDRYRGRDFVQFASPAPNGSHDVTVVRITANRLVAIPYHYPTKTWSQQRGKILDVPIRGPVVPPPTSPSDKTYRVRYLPAAQIALDGRDDDADWRRAEVEKGFGFPWKSAPAPATQFRALCDDRWLYFAFRVEDKDIVVLDNLRDEEDEVFEDRVEMYFCRDKHMHDYYNIEVDARGRAFDYHGSFYRHLDPRWSLKGLETRGMPTPAGYVVEGRIPLAGLEELKFPRLRPGVRILCGLYRAEFSHDRSGRPVEQRKTIHNRGRKLAGPPPLEDWMSWVDPKTAEPDFHVPASLGWLEVVPASE